MHNFHHKIQSKNHQKGFTTSEPLLVIGFIIIAGIIISIVYPRVQYSALKRCASEYEKTKDSSKCINNINVIPQVKKSP